MVGELNGTITELYGGFNEILLFNRQKDSCNRFSAVIKRWHDAAFKAQFLSSLISPFVSLVTYLTIGSIAVMGSFFCHKRFCHRRESAGIYPLYLADQ